MTIDSITNHAFPHHTFLMRKPTPKSALWGSNEVYCELHVPCIVDGQKMLACEPLKALGIEYQEVERWIHPIKNWKLLRFTVEDPRMLLKLHDCCGQPDIEGRDQETHRWLAAIGGDRINIRKLRKIGTRLDIPGAAHMRKAELLEVLGVAA